ncbi:MAG: PhzF family phenazine biosynthesis protein [Gemmatimonadaceae bacterium]
MSADADSSAPQAAQEPAPHAAESTRYKYYTLDVFTDRAFGGNPLAVLPDARGLSTEQMQRITAEFNLSETVFVLPPDDPTHARKLRIFTPGRELPFAGHPTVGTAFLLAALGMIDVAEGEAHIVLEEGVGPVAVTLSVEGGVPMFATLTTAQAPELRRDVPRVADVAEMLTLDISDIGAPGFTIAAVSCGIPFLLVPLRSRQCVSRAKLRREAWENVLSSAWAREIFLFDGSAIERRTPIRARMFAPSLGIGEDPATGSAAAALAAYLAMRNDSANARLDWVVEQGVEMGRPSVLRLSADIDHGAVSAVRVGGQSVLVSEGMMTVPAA